MKPLNRLRTLPLLILWVCLAGLPCPAKRTVATVTVVHAADASLQERQAAKEVRRYIYVTTGKLLPISGVKTLPAEGDLILVAEDSDPLVKAVGGSTKAPTGGYYLKTIAHRNRNLLVIAGSDPIATLHGAYRFAEHLGVRFYLEGDTIPDARKELHLADIDEVSEPVFETRGILPFHNFPQGPDWWNTDDYLVVISQLSKMGMNFIGLHWYPQWDHGEKQELSGPEPSVWIGLPEDVAPDGKVKFSYPAYYAHTKRPGTRWGFEPLSTDRFHGGANQVFERNGYGPEVMDEEMPDSADQESCNRMFNRTGEMFKTAFTHAKRVGVKTCLGTEAPLGFEPKGKEVPRDWIRGIPQEVRDRIKARGKDPAKSPALKEVYKGIFERIIKTHPLDYYCIWTYEMWGDFGLTRGQIDAVSSEMLLAHKVLQELRAPFKLATIGWRIGLPDKPALFDKILPQEVPFCGLWDEAEGFEELGAKRIKWPATWLEEDWGLVQPQLEVHRVYVDVKAAFRKKCHGMLAKHWRTRVVGPNIGGLHHILWFRGKTGSGPDRNLPPNRDAWIDQFYADWARQSFGPEAADEIAAFFARLDKAGEDGPGSIPRPVEWDGVDVSGPGAIVAKGRSWTSERKKYAFVDELASLRPRIVGAGNLERFDYWLHTFESLRLMGEFGCLRGQLERAMEREKYDEAKSARIGMARLWERIMSLQVRRLTNSSELGEIANLEQLTWNSLVTKEWDKELAEESGRALPKEAKPSSVYSGPARLVVTPRRSQMYQGDSLKLKIIAAGDVKSPTLHWRLLGRGSFQSKPLVHVSRAVYTATLPEPEGDFEYYVEAKVKEGKICFPQTAPKLCQTVIVVPEK